MLICVEKVYFVGVQQEQEGSRRENRLAPFGAKDHPCFGHCGADAVRQMGLPRCLMCVTDTCGCVVLEAGVWCWSTAWGLWSHTRKFGSAFVCIYLCASSLCMHVMRMCNMWPLHVLASVCVCVNHGLLQGRDTACHLVTAKAWLLSEKIAAGEETRCFGLVNIYSPYYQSDADLKKRGKK